MVIEEKSGYLWKGNEKWSFSGVLVERSRSEVWKW
jgi:hypothetical protein